MSIRLQTFLLVALVAALAEPLLVGCTSINGKLGAGIGDLMPQWAGGLPPDAPPRPGTVEYDRFMQEQERQRKLPAAERDKETQSTPKAANSSR
ncbi:hypothetical protein ACQR1I_08915 [Bradyrhizobium sp. HKCCYLS2038]|uniref:hypothetical protein n=1 Tax=unclassified Bradyrhizobium TaxID=2631580 RepID=UPI003EBC6C42